MSKKERPRTDRRRRERDARALIHDREKLAALSAGGSAERPIAVDSPSVIEPRVRSLPCPQCEGELVVREQRSGGPGLRAVDVTCRQCHVPRTLWFRLGAPGPN